MLIHIVVLAQLALLALEADTTTIKWHSSGAAFANPAAWLDDYLPCARDLVVFPEYYPAVLPLPSIVAIGGFVLPRLGGLLLAEDSTIQLVTGRGLNTECGSENGRAHLKPPKTSKWFDPSSWSDQPATGGSSSASSPSASIAPELVRVPCDDEHVVISSNSGPLSFDLENVQYLRLGQLMLAGSSISRNYLQELLSRDLGQLLFHNARAVTVEYYRGELCGCHKDNEQLTESVCHNVQPQCEIPHCVFPVLPVGGCCFVCGVLLTVPSEHCMEEDRKLLASEITSAMASEGLTDELQLHVDHMSSKLHGNVLQALIVDRGSYSERSVAFMRRFSAQHNNRSQLLNNAKMLFAGRPYNPNVSLASVLLILFCVVLVGVVSVIMLAHFMPQNPHLNRIPQWIHDPRRWHWRHLDLRLPRNLLFNRFDNAAAGAGSGAAAGSQVERLAVIGYDAESGEVRERAFNNPMFEQEEQMQAADAPEASLVAPKVETGELDSCSVEEQELTEINLESSEAESDAEAETKE